MEDNAKILCDLFNSNEPFLIGRNGTIELQVVSKYFTRTPIIQEEHDKLELNAGVFPQELHTNFCEDYIEALKNVDVMAEGWYDPLKKIEKGMLNYLNPTRKSIFLRNLEPYYVKPELRWTQYLDNKRVAIINPFAETCETQTYLSKAIWPRATESLLPESTIWIPIPTYYCPKLAGGKCGWPEDIRTYKEAIADIIARVLESEAQVAIIGCGGIGMILGSMLKNTGLQVIVLGGATQILFGIRGTRWESHEIISKFFNDAWVRPSPSSQMPLNYHLIENGCYW